MSYNSGVPVFQCTENEIKLLKRLRALEAAEINRVLLGLKPLAILEKIDGRLELLERPIFSAPPLSAQPGRV